MPWHGENRQRHILTYSKYLRRSGWCRLGVWDRIWCRRVWQHLKPFELIDFIPIGAMRLACGELLETYYPARKMWSRKKNTNSFSQCFNLQPHHTMSVQGWNFKLSSALKNNNKCWIIYSVVLCALHLFRCLVQKIDTYLLAKATAPFTNCPQVLRCFWCKVSSQCCLRGC